MDFPFKGHRLLAILWYLFRDRAKQTTIRPIPMQSRPVDYSPVRPMKLTFLLLFFLYLSIVFISLSHPHRGCHTRSQHAILFAKLYMRVPVNNTCPFFFTLPNTKDSVYGDT